MKDINEELKNMSKKDLFENTVKYAISSLNERQLEIYKRASSIFPQCELNREVLSVLIMGYEEYFKNSSCPIKKSIQEHSRLYLPFEVTIPIAWTLSEVFDVELDAVIKECEKYFPHYSTKLKTQ